MQPFEIDSLCALNDTSYLFPGSVTERLKEILPTWETQVKSFIKDSSLNQKIPITEKIPTNNFPLLNIERTKKSSVDLEVTFINKLPCDAVNPPLQSNLHQFKNIITKVTYHSLVYNFISTIV